MSKPNSSQSKTPKPSLADKFVWSKGDIVFGKPLSKEELDALKKPKPKKELKEWDESAHPRDESGRFGSGGGGGSTAEWAGVSNRPFSDSGGYVDFGTLSENDPLLRGRTSAMSYEQTFNLPKESRDAIYDYSVGGFEELNSGLRTGAPTNQDTLAALDRAFDKAEPLPTGIVTYRGLELRDETLKGLEPGSTFSDDGFVSTSFAQTVAERRTQAYVAIPEEGKSPVLMRIKIPAGSKALAVEFGSGIKEEREVLLSRGTEFVITDITQKDNVYYVDAQIVKQ